MMAASVANLQNINHLLQTLNDNPKKKRKKNKRTKCKKKEE